MFLLIEGDYKLQFEESNQRFYAKEKELKTAENNFQKNKASIFVSFIERVEGLYRAVDSSVLSGHSHGLPTQKTHQKRSLAQCL